MVMSAPQRVFTLLFSLYFFGKISSTGLGKCPKFEYINNFNLTRVCKFAGRWYEIERSFYLMQVVSSCVIIDLVQNERGHFKVNVATKSRWSEDLTVSEGVAAPTRRDPSFLAYKVVTKLPRILNRYLPGAGLYQVIDTDYDTYAVLWSCTNYGVAHTDLIWIWGRQSEINANLRANIYKKLDAMHLDTERLILPKNENCTYES